MKKKHCQFFLPSLLESIEVLHIVMKTQIVTVDIIIDTENMGNDIVEPVNLE